MQSQVKTNYELSLVVIKCNLILELKYKEVQALY